jgi:hypothetical protein
MENTQARSIAKGLHEGTVTGDWECVSFIARGQLKDELRVVNVTDESWEVDKK